MRGRRAWICRVVGRIEQDTVWFVNHDHVAASLRVKAVQDAAGNWIRGRYRFALQLRSGEVTSHAAHLHSCVADDTLALVQVNTVAFQGRAIEIEITIQQAIFSSLFGLKGLDVVGGRTIFATVSCL